MNQCFQWKHTAVDGKTDKSADRKQFTYIQRLSKTISTIFHCINWYRIDWSHSQCSSLSPSPPPSYMFVFSFTSLNRYSLTGQNPFIHWADFSMLLAIDLNFQTLKWWKQNVFKWNANVTTSNYENKSHTLIEMAEFVSHVNSANLFLVLLP